MLHTIDILNEIKRAKEPETVHVLRELLLKSLSPLQRRVYDYLSSKHPQYIPAMDIAKAIRKKQNHTDNILKFLSDTGLILREARVGYLAYKVNSYFPYNLYEARKLKHTLLFK